MFTGACKAALELVKKYSNSFSTLVICKSLIFIMRVFSKRIEKLLPIGETTQISGPKVGEVKGRSDKI